MQRKCNIKQLKLLLTTWILIILCTSCESIKLTIENGTGSGSYRADTKVRIKGHLPTPGHEFSHWSGNTQIIDDISSNETFVTIPPTNNDEIVEIKIKATYEVDPNALEHEIVVKNGSGSGEYLTYSIVDITADEAVEGEKFDRWVGNIKYITNPTIISQKIVVAKENVYLEATYVPQEAAPIIYEGPFDLMMIGDSITHSSPVTGNVRCELWRQLNRVKPRFDFVGDMRGQDGGIEDNCDNDHEAHGGWRADDILKIISNSASRHRPGMAVIHLGTNDIGAGQGNVSTVEEIGQIIEILQNHNSQIVIFVAGIIPNYWLPDQTQTQDLNIRLAKFVKSKTTSENPIFYVNQYLGFFENDLFDKIHPNGSGAKKMASKWFKAISDYLVVAPEVP